MKTTFSLVARDPKTGNLAVAGGSHWFAYGTLVPFAKSGIGAIATQAECNLDFGPDGLKLLEKGFNAKQTLEKLIKSDKNKDIRQVLIIDNKGNTEIFTGKKCVKFAMQMNSKNIAIAGNMLANDKIVLKMFEFFKISKLSFEEKIIKTLQLGDKSGGDIRGKKSCALQVVSKNEVEKIYQNYLYNLRIDDHTEPFKELERQFKIAKAYKFMTLGDNEFYENKNNEKAIKHYKNAYKLFPENPEILFWYTKLLNSIGKTKEVEINRIKLRKINKMWDEYWERVG